MGSGSIVLNAVRGLDYVRSEDQIKAAFTSGQAVLVHGWRIDGQISAGLRIGGPQVDSRGECYSAWEETWTVAPKSLRQVLDAAKV